jgi:hypothetical protein
MHSFYRTDIRVFNQISSKELEEGATKEENRKFGTGFLTTHLLSRLFLFEE